MNYMNLFLSMLKTAHSKYNSLSWYICVYVCVCHVDHFTSVVYNSVFGDRLILTDKIYLLYAASQFLGQVRSSTVLVA